ncbi:hypothetical protein EBH_0021080 [Eimeria brunetti]|uniref:Uncharacterized protein n=1 Tax=Eimeria brunetti TaxID=51314 RepID=U6LH75_9EIME|nr:hypothetical protein EBH_0021080 [Eimeria brunetti]
MAEAAARRRERELLQQQQQQQQLLLQQQQQYYVEVAIQPRKNQYAREYVERAARAAYTPKIGGEIRRRQPNFSSSPMGAEGDLLQQQQQQQQQLQQQQQYREGRRRWETYERETEYRNRERESWRESRDRGDRYY